MIRFSHVSLKTTAGPILNDINLEITPGECVCIAGGGGSGKTLFLRILMGEMRPTGGTVTVDGVNIHALPPKLLRHYRRAIGAVREDDQLFPDFSIAANIALPLQMRGTERGAIAKRVTELLTHVGLLDRASAFPETLHRGERRKAAFAQAIAHRPTILIADEPLAGLDRGSARIVLSLLRSLHSDGSTVILATRNPQPLASLRPRTVRLGNGTAAGDGAGFARAPVAVTERMDGPPARTTDRSGGAGRAGPITPAAV